MSQLIKWMKSSLRAKPISKRAGDDSLGSYSDFIAIAVLLGLAAFVYRAYLGTTGYVLLPTFYPYYIDPFTLFYRYYGSSWNHGLLGLPLLFYVTNVPFRSFISILSVLVGPEPLSKVLPPLFVFLTTSASYGFLRKGVGTRPLPSLLASLFVGYNPWVTIYVLSPLPALEILFTMISAYVGLYSTFRYFRTGKLYYSFLAGLASLSSLSSPPEGMAAIVSVWLMAFVLMLERGSVDSRHKLLNLITFLGIQAFALSPVVVDLAWSLADPGPTLSGSSLAFFKSITAANSLALMFPYPLLALEKYIVGNSVVPYVILNSMIVIIASTALLRITRKFSMFTFYAGILFIFSSLLLKGINQPFPQVYTFLTSIFPVLGFVLRNPLHFMISSILALSIILAIGFEWLINVSLRFSKRITRRQLGRTILALSVSFMLVAPAAYASLESVNNPGPGVIPRYYSSAIQFLYNQLRVNTFRVFIPGTYASNYYYWFRHHVETPVVADLFPSITYYSLQGAGTILEGYYNLPKLIGELPANDTAIPEILGLMNVKFIVIQHDFVPAPYYDPSEDLNKASSFYGVKEFESFGKIEILVNSRFRPNIYIPNIVVPINSTDSFVTSARLVSSMNLSVDTAYIPANLLRGVVSETNASGYSILSSKGETVSIFKIPSIPTITNVTRINYDDYMVSVSDITGPFMLVLEDAYSPLWSLSVSAPESENVNISHFLVNTYSNAWLINSSSTTLKISIIYKGREFLYLSYSLLILYIFIGALLFIVSHTKLPSSFVRSLSRFLSSQISSRAT